MLSPQALMKGLVGRLLGVPMQDGAESERAVRMGRFGEQYVRSLVRKQHLLADQGSYFIASNGNQTGILSTPATGFVATTPALIIYNSSRPASARAKWIYLDYMNLVTTVVGSAASGLVNLQGGLYLDSSNRYASGGNEITSSIVNANMDIDPRSSAARVYFGALTAAAAIQARALCPLRIIRPAVSGTVLDVVGETKWFNFGGVEGALNGSITIANANFITVPLPPVIIGPDECALIYLWQNVGATNVAATYAPEIGYWEE
jgi:hypothetical protein